MGASQDASYYYKRYHTDPEYRRRKLAATKRWSERNDHKIVAARLRRNFGITPKEYEELLRKQGGLCAICRKPEARKGFRLAVDHDHTTNRVRGLLCTRCNKMLRLAEDHLDEILAYLA